jgi:WSC domain
MDPSVVGSPLFGQLFKTALPGNYNGAPEQIFSQPLVYTPADGIQYVYFATTQNNVYKLDAKTGVIVAQRNLHIPFLTADLNGCVDINPLVGVTSTGVIDPTTDTLYLTSKTYANQTGGNGPQGKPNGRYYLHAINVNDLSERPNFPVNLEGTVARNNPIRSFNGGIQHQRPALLHSGQYIYAGFASHCVQYNFTGWIMGWDKTTGANVERYAMEGAGVPNTTPGGGVWMSGGGLSSDDAGSMFFATGNGYASQLNTIPVNGHNPPTALEEAAVHMTINSDGSLTIVDFFMPWEKTQLDGADRDLGTSPLELLPSQFSCGDVQRIGVVTGKSGKTYWLNLDNLGGYRNGPNNLDNVIQVYQNENSVYAGAGVYPLEGGYIYINVIQYPTHVFKFSCDGGVPSFSKVADSPETNAYVLGVGHGTVTSLNGQPGTGLVWTSDVQGLNLRIYNAVPQGTLMTLINSFSVPGTTKFTRPVFGDGRVYMGTTLGFVYGFGSPVNAPLNCSSPYEFGSANLNSPTPPMTITCTANIAVTVSGIKLTDTTNFNISNAPAIPLAVAAGGSFTFKAYFSPQLVGPISSNVVINTTNSVAGYSTITPIILGGSGQSVGPLLSINPTTLTFQGVITGQEVGGVNETVIISNLGNSDLTISSIQYSQTSTTGPWIAANSSSMGPQVGPFTFIDLPSVIPGNTGLTVTVNFDTPTSGNFAAYLQVNSDGGDDSLVIAATSGAAPVALLEFQTPDGLSWVAYQPGTNFTFGNVTENTTRSLKLRLTNIAPPGSSRLSLTVSKPPFGVPGIIGANNDIDLAEGTSLAPGENATAMLYCSVPKEQWNSDPYSGNAQWTMNVDDPNFGHQLIQFFCTAVSEQAPPLQPNGLGVYRYAGCFKENNPGRQLKTQLYSKANNTNEMCIAACAAAGYAYCGTQYTMECWAGPTIPIQQVDDGNCNYPCTGNVNEICGGNGVGPGAGGAYISLFASSGLSGNPTPPTNPGGPFTDPGTDGYTSIGCYTEGTNTRALPNLLTTTSRTVASCLAACSSSYIYAGLEYGGEVSCVASVLQLFGDYQY